MIEPGSLLAYSILQWEGYNPANHHRLLADKLEAVARGEVKRLIVQMPPRHGKSMEASEFFPAWYLGNFPSHQILASTYAQELAGDFGRKVRNLCQTTQHLHMFPGFSLSQDSQAACRFHTPDRGVYQGVGIGGAATGRGAHLLLIDDPVKSREEAESEIMRKRVKDWYTSVARTRLMPGGAIVVIQTRWHEDDLAGWLQKEHAHEGWEVLNLPALAEPNDPLGRAEGAALWPECYPVSELSVIKQSIGARDWSALYQQRPSAMEGSILKRGNWGYFKPAEVNPAGLIESLCVTRVIQAWDTAFKTGNMNDYSVGVTIGVAKARYYILDVWRDRAEFPDLKRALVSQATKWGAHAVVIEDAASGQSLIQELRRNTRIPLVTVKADKDKTSRANAISAIHEAGLCYLPENEHWVSDFVDECAGFPSAAHDDQVDAFVHALTYARPMAQFDAEEKDIEEFPGMVRKRGGWAS